MKDLSIIIPAKDEPYLSKTILDIEKHAETDYEILVGDDDKEKLGQRGLMNRLAQQATGKYLMKCDAHCSFQQGFDVTLLKDMDNNTVMSPMLAQLDPEEWQIISQPITTTYYFDTNLVFQYEPERSTEHLVESMAVSGACFVVDREKYWEWNLCDEKLGSWGFQCVEVGLKAWMAGARVVTNTNCFYGHWFRNKLTGEQRYSEQEARKVQKKLKKQFPLEDIKWIAKKFNFPCDWSCIKN